MGKKKISVDLDVDVYNAILRSQRNYTEKNDKKIPVSKIINDSLNVTLNMGSDLREELLPNLTLLLRHYKRQCVMSRFESQMFALKKYSKMANELKGLLTLIENYNVNQNEEIDYVEYPMNDNKRLRCPAEWVTINEEEADVSEYAYVIEVRRGEDIGLPMLIYFSMDKCETKDYKKIIKHAKTSFPKLQKLLDDNHIQDDLLSETGTEDNVIKVLHSSAIGVYQIETEEEVEAVRKYDVSYSPPAGAIIISE